MQVWAHVDGGWHEGEHESASFHWFRFDSPDAEGLQALQVRFDLHPLSVEDCLSMEVHHPKVDEFENHLFIVFAALVGEGEADPQPDELDAYLGHEFLITYSDQPLPEVERVVEAMAAGIHLRPGPDGLLYEIVDRVVDGMLPQVSTLAERLDHIQHRILSNPVNADDSREIVALRGTAGDVRRLITPQMALVQRLSRGEFAYVREPNRIYYRDIYDHLVRVDISLEGVRDDAETVLATYLSAVNNRLSEVMKVLSVVAALSLPATVISGIFGTNFDNVPGLHNQWGFVAMMTGMIGLAVSMAYYFRRRGWF